jgi:hypothetical protein
LLWQINTCQAQLETDPNQSSQLLREAREIVTFIAGHTSPQDIKQYFLQMANLNGVLQK